MLLTNPSFIKDKSILQTKPKINEWGIEILPSQQPKYVDTSIYSLIQTV